MQNSTNPTTTKTDVNLKQSEEKKTLNTSEGGSSDHQKLQLGGAASFAKDHSSIVSETPVKMQSSTKTDGQIPNKRKSSKDLTQEIRNILKDKRFSLSSKSSVIADVIKRYEKSKSPEGQTLLPPNRNFLQGGSSEDVVAESSSGSSVTPTASSTSNVTKKLKKNKRNRNSNCSDIDNNTNIRDDDADAGNDNDDDNCDDDDTSVDVDDDDDDDDNDDDGDNDDDNDKGEEDEDGENESERERGRTK